MMEGGEEEDDIAELQQKIVSAKLPTHAQKAAEKELKVHVIRKNAKWL